MLITEVALKIIQNETLESCDDNGRNIILAGSKSVGKSHLLYSFLEKTERPKETLVPEYSFGRKSQKQSINKTICHVWEYGGRLEMLKNVLTSIPNHKKQYYCIMVDLSKVKSIWYTMEMCIQAAKETYIEPKDLPEFIIIGGKYDIFKNFEGEIKKIICMTMRSVALICNADLLFYSSKESYLLRKAKELFYTVGFGNGLSLKEKNINYSKPLIIPKGTDTWESIGVTDSTLEQVKQRYLSCIAPEYETAMEIKPLYRSHPEPILDSLIALKYEELRSMESFDPSISDHLMLL